MPKVIVFGGAGFLGSHVADALSDAGHEVVIYDLKQSGYLRIGQKMIIGDILDNGRVLESVNGCDYVYNFAGIGDLAEAKKNPLDSVKINILGNANILEACRKSKIKRFIFASTLYVYSNSGSFYRTTKQACELLIEDYYQAFGLDFTILRYGSLYGLRANENNWIYQLLKQALTENKITRYGDGEEIREYIHVCDAARISVEILAEQYKGNYAMITGNQPMKIKDLFVMIREILGGKVKLEFIPSNSKEHYEVTPFNFSPKLAKRINSSHYIDLGEGLLNLLDQIYKKNKP